MTVKKTAEYEVGPFSILLQIRETETVGEVTEGRCNCDSWDADTNPVCRHVTAYIHHLHAGVTPELVSQDVRPVEVDE